MLHLLFHPFKKMLHFKGREARKEYWTFSIFWAIVVSLITNLGPEFSNSEDPWLLLPVIVAAILFIIYFITQLSLSVRRLHDTDRSGWWYLIVIIPIVGAIWLFVLFCLDGTKGKNRFGPDPKKR